MAKANTEVQPKVTSEDKIVPIDTLVANDINPRKIHQKQFEALKKSLQEFPEMKESLRSCLTGWSVAVAGRASK